MKTVFRSKFGNYRAGSKANGEPQYLPGPGGAMVINPRFRDGPLVEFNDHVFSTSDQALIEQIKQLPGYSAEPGGGDFWLDDGATKAQNEPSPAPASTAAPADESSAAEQVSDAGQQAGDAGNAASTEQAAPTERSDPAAPAAATNKPEAKAAAKPEGKPKK